MENNKKIPKIRFKGFNDEWEQHKLDNYLDKCHGLSQMIHL